MRHAVLQSAVFQDHIRVFTCAHSVSADVKIRHLQDLFRCCFCFALSTIQSVSKLFSIKKTECG